MKLDNVRWSNIRPLGGWEIIEKRRWMETVVKTQGATDYRAGDAKSLWLDGHILNITSDNAPFQSHVVVRELMRRK